MTNGALVALVSSALVPSELLPGVLPREVRCQQTTETIRSLRAAGVSLVVLADAASGSDHAAIPRELRSLVDDSVTVVTPGGANKGLNELFLLRSALRTLPHDVPILKISGRYVIEPRAPILSSTSQADFAGRFYKHRRGETVSTRAYVVTNRRKFEQMIDRSLSEMYAAPFRVTGLRSAFSVLRLLTRPTHDQTRYFDPTISVEIAMLRALKYSALTVERMERLGISGVLALDGTQIIE